MKKNILLLAACLLLFSNSCAPKYFKKVNPETKTKFGITVTNPSIAIFFVENENSDIGLNNVDEHTKIANKLYNTYGPARENFIIARTNARDFKFNLKNKTYYIDVHNLPQRTAMIVFDGFNKPTVYFSINQYKEIVDAIANQQE